MQAEKEQLLRNRDALQQKASEVMDMLSKHEHQDETADIETYTESPDPLKKQRTLVAAEIVAMDDALAVLGRALQRGTLDVSAFMKVRAYVAVALAYR